jgi:16S rRNA (uracil1498-N3)-methyltransferase
MSRFTTSGQDQKGPRLYVADDLASGSTVQPDRGQAHHLRDVMRLRVGDTVLLFNGRDGEWAAEVAAAERKSVDLKVTERTRAQSPAGDLWYLFAPLKRGRLDYIVQKATELGVVQIVPVRTRYTNVKSLKPEKLRANIVEAAEQCGILSVPQLGDYQSLEAVLGNWDPARRIIYCDEAARISDPIGALSGIPPGPLAVLIGPEGGFSNEERTQLAALDCVTPISLGPRIMRADTAGVAALTLVQAVLGDLRGP